MEVEEFRGHSATIVSFFDFDVGVDKSAKKFSLLCGGFMKISKQGAVLHAHLGDSLYFMFGEIKAYFKYSSAQWRGRNGESGNGDDLPKYLNDVYGKPFGPHEVRVDVMCGVIVPDPPHCMTGPAIVYLDDVIFKF